MSNVASRGRQVFFKKLYNVLVFTSCFCLNFLLDYLPCPLRRPQFHNLVKVKRSKTLFMAAFIPSVTTQIPPLEGFA